MNIFILVTLLVMPCFAMESPTRRIVNGEVIERGKWPFLVSLHYLQPHNFTKHSKMQHLCGGSLIDPYWVLTAAHCVSKVFGEGIGNVSNWKVVLGEHNQYLKDDEEQILDIREIKVHPQFKPLGNRNLLNDIALLRLKIPASFSDYVNKIDLRFDDIPVGTKCQVAGWGQVSEDSTGWGMYVPLETNVEIVSTSSCSQAYERTLFSKVDDSTLCATYPVDEELPPDMENNDSCRGDSGGPLICETGWLFWKKTQLVGIVSAGLECGSKTYPGIYTKVSYFKTWIEEILNDN